ncbi:MAG: hypothetical protein RR934_10880 [Gordonibacter sp.]|uniref:hypothetical protein n=1 Tax=Gordonibacter sp. TaxID=1968902 RepID=UPI00322034A1
MRVKPARRFLLRKTSCGLDHQVLHESLSIFCLLVALVLCGLRESAMRAIPVSLRRAISIDIGIDIDIGLLSKAP